MRWVRVLPATLPAVRVRTDHPPREATMVVAPEARDYPAREGRVPEGVLLAVYDRAPFDILCEALEQVRKPGRGQVLAARPMYKG